MSCIHWALLFGWRQSCLPEWRVLPVPAHSGHFSQSPANITRYINVRRPWDSSSSPVNFRSTPRSARGWLQLSKQLRQERLVILPAAHRAVVEGLANLCGAGGAHRASRLVKVQAWRLPLKSNPTDQPACCPFQVAHHLFVLHLKNLRRRDLPPVLHQPQVFVKAPSNVFRIAGPINLAKVGHPARQRRVTQSPPAVDESRLREQSNEEPEKQVVTGHLVHDALGSSVQLR